ncbi:MAG: aminotransferase class IV [Candidatus Competibacteraceae bacterium]|nr:aminotransferase class IV [Candidatus Competibacteraceae bacterium]
MTPIAYLNGQMLPLDQVRISPLDRGFLFADGLYEMIPAYGGRLLGLERHLERLAVGLDFMQLDPGRDGGHWHGLLEELVERNGGGDLAVYLQITRGAATHRDHGFPIGVPATVFAMTTPLTPLPQRVVAEGISTVTRLDIRWGACHIKTIALLANVLARQQALEAGAEDAILVRDGLALEGAASNLFMVRHGELVTPPKDRRILPGITRDLVLELARGDGIPVREADIPAAELVLAEEVWLTSSTREIVPVSRIDDQPVGTGRPGPLFARVRELYQNHKDQSGSTRL